MSSSSKKKLFGHRTEYKSFGQPAPPLPTQRHYVEQKSLHREPSYQKHGMVQQNSTFLQNHHSTVQNISFQPVPQSNDGDSWGTDLKTL